MHLRFLAVFRLLITGPGAGPGAGNNDSNNGMMPMMIGMMMNYISLVPITVAPSFFWAVFSTLICGPNLGTNWAQSGDQLGPFGAYLGPICSVFSCQTTMARASYDIKIGVGGGLS